MRADVRVKGALGSEGCSWPWAGVWRDWGHWGILFVVLYASISSFATAPLFKEPIGRMNRRMGLRTVEPVSIPYQLKPSPSAGVSGLRPRTWFYEWPWAGWLVRAEGHACRWLGWSPWLLWGNHQCALPGGKLLWGPDPGEESLVASAPVEARWTPPSLHHGRLGRIMRALLFRGSCGSHQSPGRDTA